MITILLIPVSASWGESVRAELHPGEMIEVDGYSTELSDISVVPGDPSVLLRIYTNDTTSSAVMRAGEVFVLKDERNRERLGIVLEEISREGQISNESRAVLGIRMRSRPEISISMSSDRDLYHAGDRIRVDVFVENAGDGDAESIRLQLDLSGSQDASRGSPGDLSRKMRRSVLRPGEVWRETISFQAPALPEREIIELVAAAEYLDGDGKIYRSESVLPVNVAGPVELHKYVQETQTFGRTYYVIDTIRNTGNVRLNLSLRDAAGDVFRSDGLPVERFELVPGETRIVSYAVKARRPGEGLVLPQAICTYTMAGRTYTAISESPVVDVFGPHIEAKRHATSAGNPDVFQVCMEVKNTGNRFAGVRAYSIFPGWIEILNGKNDISFALAAGSSRSICWSVRCPNGSCVLPPIDLIYFDSGNNMFRCEVPPLKLETEIPSTGRENNTENGATEISEPVRRNGSESHPSGSALALLLLISALIWARSL